MISLHELKRIPLALKTLLADVRVTFTGSKVTGDVNRLARDCTLKVASSADLAARANELGLLQRGQKRGLDAMCRTFLSLHIPNKREMQMSNWEATPLSDEQLQYGAMDAVVSARLWVHFEAAAQAEQVPSKTSLPNDTRVRVCNARHAGVAAIGVVQSQ